MRVEAISNYAGVATFIAGFALADLGSMNNFDLQFPLGEIYLILMSFTACVTACNSVLCILFVVVFQRLTSWDLGVIKIKDRPADDHELFVSVFGDPGERHYTTHIFEYMYDNPRAPLHFTIICFPYAVVSYLGAIAVKVANYAGEQGVIVRSICPIMLFLGSIPILRYSSKMVKIIVA